MVRILQEVSAADKEREEQELETAPISARRDLSAALRLKFREVADVL